MKATLSYNLPEENEEFNTALKGIDYKIVLQSTLEFIRGKVKHESDQWDPAYIEALEAVRAHIVEAAIDRGVDYL